jgi:hypothetical protein
MRVFSFVTVLAIAGLCAGVGRAQAPRRDTMGMLRATGEVDVSLDGSTWEPSTGGPIVEGAIIRTGLGGSVTLELQAGDVVGLGEGAVLALETAIPPKLRLDAGHARIHLQPSSVTAIDTPAGIVRTPLATSGAGPRREAAVIVSGYETSVHAVHGDLDVLQHGSGMVELEPGQVATFTYGNPEPEITSVRGTPDDPDAPRPNGNPRSDPKILASPLVAQLFVAVGVITGGVFGGLTGF